MKTSHISRSLAVILLGLAGSAHAADQFACDEQVGVGNKAACYAAKGLVFGAGSVAVAGNAVSNAVFGKPDLNWPGRALRLVLQDGTTVQAEVTKTMDYRMSLLSSDVGRTSCRQHTGAAPQAGPAIAAFCTVTLDRKEKPRSPYPGTPAVARVLSFSFAIDGAGNPLDDVIKLPAGIRIPLAF